MRNIIWHKLKISFVSTFQKGSNLDRNKKERLTEREKKTGRAHQSLIYNVWPYFTFQTPYVFPCRNDSPTGYHRIDVITVEQNF